MNIVLEGPDNAGKSTLAKYLQEHLGLPLRHSGGPGKHPGEIQERVDRYYNDPHDMIYDRHPCISQGIYLSALRLAGEYVTLDREERFYKSKPLIIYCRNRGTMEGHVESEHTSREYVRRVELYFNDLCAAYDKWSLGRANIVYRIGDDMDAVVRIVRAAMNDDTALLTQAVKQMQRFDPVKDVEDFHKKFGQQYTGLPRALPDDLASFREDFLQEEITEYKAHAEQARRELRGTLFSEYDNIVFTQSLEGMLDALIDEVYVALGTAHLHGFNFREAWRRVHDANMKKIRTTATMRGKRGESKYDVIKPPGWVAPTHYDLVAQHAHHTDGKNVQTG